MIHTIPLKNQNQTFSIALANATYTFLIVWNDYAAAWELDISDAAGVKIISGIALVTGIDLLAPYAYLNFGGTLTCSTDGNTDAVPTAVNLGSSAKLYYTTP